MFVILPGCPPVSALTRPVLLNIFHECGRKLLLAMPNSGIVQEKVQTVEEVQFNRFKCETIKNYMLGQMMCATLQKSRLLSPKHKKVSNFTLFCLLL